MAGMHAGRLLLIAAFGLSACAEGRPPANVGRAAFQEHCSSCHGAEARGDGPMAVFVTTGVPDLRQLRKRSGGEFPRSHLVKVVTRISDLHDGVVAMPDFGALLGASPIVYTTAGGERIKTDATILAIADYLERIQD